MPSIQQIREEVEAKRKNLHDIFASHDDISSIPADEAKKIKPMNDELTTLVKSLEEAEELQGIKSRVTTPRTAPEIVASGQRKSAEGGGGYSQPAIKSIAEIIRDDAGYKSFLERGTKGVVSIDVPEAESKTLMTLTTINSQPERDLTLRPSIQDRTTVTDLIPQASTNTNALTYFEETLFTNAAATVAEGGTKPEAALGFTERTDAVRKLAVWIPATQEMLEDVAGIQAYVESRLVFMLKRLEEAQILNGNGTPPNISGILNRAIQTQARGTDPTPDAIYKAMTKIETLGDADPTGIVMNPNDWQNVRLLRTTDGAYLWGPASEPGPERIFGLPVRKTALITAGTALVGAFSPHSMIRRRSGITITLSTEHSTFFVENKIAILAETRLALQVFRPFAFCSVTGVV